MKQVDIEWKELIDKALPAIEVSGLSKRYTKNRPYAIKDISFKIQPGEIHGFIGANGAGKTTTIKSIIGAYANYEGDIKILGFKNTSIEAKKLLGYIPENAFFPSGVSTHWYLVHMSHMSGISYKEAVAFTNRTLEELGLTAIANRNPNKLSSGQKKKVLLAQALVGNPSILIMDEPAANLDPKARKDFFETLKGIQRQGKTIFLSSHILAELDEYVNSITILDGGVLVYSGKKDGIAMNKGKMEYVFKFKDNISKDFTDYISVYGLNHKINEDGSFLVELTNEDNYEKIMAFILKNKLIIESMHTKSMSLNEIYDQYVIKGSVETGTGGRGRNNA